MPVFKVTDKFSPSPGANSILEMYVISVAVEIDHIVGVLVEKGSMLQPENMLKLLDYLYLK